MSLIKPVCANPVSPLLQQLRLDGFADLGEHDLAEPIHEVARQIGSTIGAIPAAKAEELRASEVGSKGLNTYGGNFGFGSLPLHTDLAHWFLPPRYILLRCVVGSPNVATQVLHHRVVGANVPETLMKQALFSPRRRVEGKMYLVRLLTDQMFRWDELFLEPKNRAAHEVRQLMVECAKQLKPASFNFKRAGQTLLIDNWRALHGRSAVTAPDAGRCLQRIYLDGITNGN
jgi:L-asparagine oxygenase